MQDCTSAVPTQKSFRDPAHNLKAIISKTPGISSAQLEACTCRDQVGAH